MDHKSPLSQGLVPKSPLLTSLCYYHHFSKLIREFTCSLIHPLASSSEAVRFASMLAIMPNQRQIFKLKSALITGISSLLPIVPSH